MTDGKDPLEPVITSEPGELNEQIELSMEEAIESNSDQEIREDQGQETEDNFARKYEGDESNLDRQMPRVGKNSEGNKLVLICVLLPICLILYSFVSDIEFTNDEEKHAYLQSTGIPIADQPNKRHSSVTRMTLKEGYEEPKIERIRPGELGSNIPNYREPILDQVATIEEPQLSDEEKLALLEREMALKEQFKKKQHEAFLFEMMKNSPLTESSYEQHSQRNEQPKDAYLEALRNGQYNSYGTDPISNELALIEAMKPTPVDARDSNHHFAEQVNNASVERVTAFQQHNLETFIPQGKLIHATLKTAIDSTLPGDVLAIVSHDVYGMQGDKILIPKGSQLYGKYNSAIKRGQTRVFVAWPRVLTPTGVDVAIGSTGTDSLGRAGFDGHVDSHFWTRFGNSTLLSVLGAGASNWGVGTTEQNNAASVYRDAMSKSFQQSAARELEENINIDDTIYKDQGERIIILVSRDLDFSRVDNNYARN